MLAGAIEQLDANAFDATITGKRHAVLARASLHTLAMLADTHCGLQRLLDVGLLPRVAMALTELQPAAAPASAAAFARVLEVAAQRPAGAEKVAACALPALVSFVAAHAQHKGQLCATPALGALRQLVRSLNGTALSDERARGELKKLATLQGTSEEPASGAQAALTAVLSCAAEA